MKKDTFKFDSKKKTSISIVCLFLRIFFISAALQTMSYGSGQPVLIEKTGDTIPMNLFFVDENGKKVPLKNYFDKPVLLSLVFYRCPSICSPLLREIARIADLSIVRPGEDYRLITISFDHTERPNLAKNARNHLLSTFKQPLPPDGWIFMTGDSLAIYKLTSAVGFGFQKKDGDYIHPATIIALDTHGRIIRYLNGIKFLPTDLSMAVVDAQEGNVRSFMQKIQQFCYAYDPEGQTYVVQLNRIVFAISLLFVLIFIGFLKFFRPIPKRG